MLNVPVCLEFFPVYKRFIFTFFTEEVTTLRANLKEARQEHQKLEAQLRDLRSSENSNKVRQL